MHVDIAQRLHSHFHTNMNWHHGQEKTPEFSFNIFKSKPLIGSYRC